HGAAGAALGPGRAARELIVVRAAWAAVLVLLIACGTGQLVRGGRINQDLLAALEARLSAVRGLQFPRPVTPRVLTPPPILTTRRDRHHHRPGDRTRPATARHAAPREHLHHDAPHRARRHHRLVDAEAPHHAAGCVLRYANQDAERVRRGGAIAGEHRAPHL